MTRFPHFVIAAVIAFSPSTIHAFDFEFARASSTAGQFSVVLPKPFRELPENFGDNPRAAIRPKQSLVIGGKPAPGVIFVATKLTYSSTNDARSVVRTVTGTELPGFKRAYLKKVEAAGLPGLEIKSLSRSTVGYLRVLLAGDTVFELIVEAPAAKDDEIKQPARKFLNSLMLAKRKKT